MWGASPRPAPRPGGPCVCDCLRVRMQPCLPPGLGGALRVPPAAESWRRPAPGERGPGAAPAPRGLLARSRLLTEACRCVSRSAGLLGSGSEAGPALLRRALPPQGARGTEVELPVTASHVLDAAFAFPFRADSPCRSGRVVSTVTLNPPHAPRGSVTTLSGFEAPRGSSPRLFAC